MADDEVVTRCARLLVPAVLVALTAVLLTGSVGATAATGRAPTSKHVLSTWLPYWDGTASIRCWRTPIASGS